MTDELEKDILDYRSYHSHPVNKLIHFFCIPVIMYSIIVTFGKFYFSVYKHKNHKFLFHMYFDEAIVLFYNIYYLSYGFKIGVLMVLYNFIFYILSLKIYKHFNHSNTITFYLFLSAFLIQFIGHFIEGSRPAMFVGLKQTLLQAPLFNLNYIYPNLLTNY